MMGDFADVGVGGPLRQPFPERVVWRRAEQPMPWLHVRGAVLRQHRHRYRRGVAGSVDLLDLYAVPAQGVSGPEDGVEVGGEVGRVAGPTIVAHTRERRDANEPYVGELRYLLCCGGDLLLRESTLLPLEEYIARRVETDQQVLRYTLIYRSIVDPAGVLQVVHGDDLGTHRDGVRRKLSGYLVQMAHVTYRSTIAAYLQSTRHIDRHRLVQPIFDSYQVYVRISAVLLAHQVRSQPQPLRLGGQHASILRNHVEIDDPRVRWYMVTLMQLYRGLQQSRVSFDQSL